MENCLLQAISPFLTKSQIQSICRRQIQHDFKDNFVLIRVENNVGKMRKCCSAAFSPFPSLYFKRLLLQGHLNSGLIGKDLKL